MRKLQIFVITNACKRIFVTFGMHQVDGSPQDPGVHVDLFARRVSEVKRPEKAIKNSLDIVHTSRDARWFVFKPKISIWVNFGGSCNGRC
jgi:hypothetical protein